MQATQERDERSRGIAGFGKDMYHWVQQPPDGEETALRELEYREAEVRVGRMDPDEALTPFMHVDETTGFHMGHIYAD